MAFSGFAAALSFGVVLSGCGSLVPPCDDAPLRVAVYVGNGARAAGAFRHLQIATVAEGVEGFPVDAEMICGGVLERADVLVMPGGRSVVEAKALGTNGFARVKAFIRGGGGFIGTCAGCFLLSQPTSSHKNMMGLVPYRSPDEFGSGHAELNLRFTGAAQDLLGIRSNSVHRVNYSGGPVLVPGKPVGGADFSVVATYDSDYSSKKRTSMAGKAAMVAGTYGKGRIFLSALHPEKDPDDHGILRRAVRFVSGRDVAWELPRRKPGQLAVGVLCDAAMGVRTARAVQGLVRSGAFDLEPLSGDEVKAGAYAHLDALLALDTIEPKSGSIGLGGNRRFTEAFLARGGKVVAWGAHGAEYAKLGSGVTAVKTVDEAASALAAIASAPAHEAPEWALAKVGKPIRAAVYADTGGINLPVLSLLDLSAEYEVTVVSGADIRRGALKGADLLVMPGGSCQAEYKTLGPEGMAEITRFVRAGGKYYGICAGAFLASRQKTADRPRLGLVPWQNDDCPAYRGWGQVRLKLTDEGRGVFAGSAASRTVMYWGGPVLKPGAPVEDSDIKALATYDWEVMSTCTPAARTSMRGKAAIVGGRVGKGRVYVQCPHPEKSEGSFDMVLAGFEYLTGVRPTWRRRHHVRGQFVVGCESESGTEYAGLRRALDRCREFYARGLNGTWRAGDMLHLDALFVPRPTAKYFEKAEVKGFLAAGRPVVALTRTKGERKAVEGLTGVMAVTSCDEVIPALRRLANPGGESK